MQARFLKAVEGSKKTGVRWRLVGGVPRVAPDGAKRLPREVLVDPERSAQELGAGPPRGTVRVVFVLGEYLISRSRRRDWKNGRVVARTAVRTGAAPPDVAGGGTAVAIGKKVLRKGVDPGAGRRAPGDAACAPPPNNILRPL